ncbi:MAG: protein translocase subunit SecF, partial [Desulfopila sp.]
MKWFESPTFDFIKGQKIMYVVSGILFVGSIIAVLTMGLNYGIDFRGGKEFVFDFENNVEVTEIRSALTE